MVVSYQQELPIEVPRTREDRKQAQLAVFPGGNGKPPTREVSSETLRTGTKYRLFISGNGRFEEVQVSRKNRGREDGRDSQSSCGLIDSAVDRARSGGGSSSTGPFHCW